MSACNCLVDGTVTKTVQSTCVFAAYECDWPQMQGTPAWTSGCPPTTSAPLTGGGADGAAPQGCLAQPQGACKDGHVYSAECQEAPGNPVIGAVRSDSTRSP